MTQETKGGNTLWNEDARKLRDFVEENTVDVTITSPPYYNLKSYGHAEGQIGFGQDLIAYKSDLIKVFSSVYEVSKDTGSLWVIADNIRVNRELFMLPAELARWIGDVGWNLQDLLIWDKVKSHPGAHGRVGFRKIYEQILVFSKSEKFKLYSDRVRNHDLSSWWVKWPERYKTAGKIPGDIWSFKIPAQGTWSRWPLFKRQKLHECPFAPELVERILLLTTDEGDLALDPFAGSGMALAVSACMNRKFLGFEINSNYCENFWNQVLPAMKNWYAQRIAQPLLSDTEVQARLVKLKKLKYGKLLSQQLASEMPAFRPTTTFVLDSKDGSVDIYLLYDDRTKTLDNRPRPANVSDKIEVLRRRPPLKGFDIRADIHVTGTGKFIKEKCKELKWRHLWLYKRHHMYESSVTFDEWAKNLDSGAWRGKYFVGTRPPIVSNIAIYQVEVDLRKQDQLSGI